MLSRSDGGIVPFLSAKNVWFFGCDFSEYTDSLRSQLPPSTWLMYASHPEAYDIDSAPVHIGHRSNLELLLQDTSLQFVVLSTRIKSMMSFFEEHASGRCQYVHGAFSHESRRVENIYFLTDELLSRLFVRRSRAQSMGAELDLLLHIRPLDYVVHIDHGIGRFIAIVEKESIASVKEYLELHYRDDGKLFVPLTDISKITKYI